MCCVVRRVLLELVDRLAHAARSRRRSPGGTRAARSRISTGASRLEDLADVRLPTLRHEAEQRRRDVVLDHGDAAHHAALALDDAAARRAAGSPRRSSACSPGTARRAPRPTGSFSPDLVDARADAERDLVDDVLVRTRVDDRAERPRVRAVVRSHARRRSGKQRLQCVADSRRTPRSSVVLVTIRAG